MTETLWVVHQHDTVLTLVNIAGIIDGCRWWSLFCGVDTALLNVSDLSLGDVHMVPMDDIRSRQTGKDLVTITVIIGTRHR